jgi:hypothetical protein
MRTGGARPAGSDSTCRPVRANGSTSQADRSTRCHGQRARRRCTDRGACVSGRPGE